MPASNNADPLDSIRSAIEGIKASLSAKGSAARTAEKEAREAANKAAVESIPPTLRGEIKAYLATLTPGSKFTALSMGDAPVEVTFMRSLAFVKARGAKGGLAY